ncbi:hypothetical protein THERMOT_722 [Bathymodiolus thermophilus thioautotrophic gill symbiont]|uniref:Uncharacterized protein n=1 Tax=Bathymodiolus thermophilus thioautotrophic gill symbiont TaxID=2360 RepID=A0A8H8XEW8_9GAMM|nr:hypothetical protein THERMOT_722 [Bathymodiolus thermophilus thioautotrophic gill symbiont]CAB5505819.1 hypothetical protein THERMOS_2192 [Bathymodiolus thermophilus thioautotrophic gill symbiont]
MRLCIFCKVFLVNNLSVFVEIRTFFNARVSQFRFYIVNKPLKITFRRATASFKNTSKPQSL